MTNISKDISTDKRKEEKEETILARGKIEKCKTMKTKNEQINCMYETLHDITVAQDITNLTIMKTLNDDEDPRWIPIHMTDKKHS